MSKLMSIICICFVVLAPGLALSADFPTKPVEIIIPFNPGGAADICARSIADIAKETLGIPVVPVNKPGGAGVVAWGVCAKAKPDGYGVTVSADTLVTVGQMRDVAFDPFKSFEYIMQYMNFAGAIGCRSDKPWKSMKDLIDYSKQNPGKVTYGIPGTGGSPHLAAEFIAQKEGVKWKMIPYDDTPSVTTAVLGGHIDIAITGGVVAPWRQVVKAGELRVLAVEAKDDLEVFPGAATFEERGYKLAIGATFGFIAPKGTPPEIIKKLHDSFKLALEDQRYKDTCKRVGVRPFYRSGAEMLDDLKKQHAEVGKVIRELGMAKPN